MELVLCGTKSSYNINKASDWAAGKIMKCIIVFEGYMGHTTNSLVRGSHKRDTIRMLASRRSMTRKSKTYCAGES